MREAAAQLGLAAHLKLHICDAYALADTFDDDASNFTFDGGGGGGGGGGDDDDDDDRMLDLLWLDFGAGVGGRLHAFLSAWWQRLRGQSAALLVPQLALSSPPRLPPGPDSPGYLQAISKLPPTQQPS